MHQLHHQCTTTCTMKNKPATLAFIGFLQNAPLAPPHFLLITRARARARSVAETTKHLPSSTKKAAFDKHRTPPLRALAMRF